MTDTDYMPEDEAGYSDAPDLYIDLSDNEAASAPLVPVPTNIYHLVCTDGELKESKSANNPGKPMYNLEFTIQDGEHAGRKLWTIACLWAGAAFTIVQIGKAMGRNVEPGQFKGPPVSEIIGTHFEARVIKKGPSKGKDGQEYDEKNEIKWFKEWNGKVPASKEEENYLP